MTIRTSEVRAFIATVESDSISAAARQLGLTQSALSEALQSFEKAVGVTLVDRKNNMAMTDSGTRVAPSAWRLIHAIDQFEQAGSRLADEAARRVRFGVLAGDVLAYLAPVLQRIHQVCPDRTVDVTTFENSRSLVDAIRQGRAALGLLPDPVPSDLTAAKVASSTCFLVAPARWELAGGVEELRGRGAFPYISVRRAMPEVRSIDRELANLGLEPRLVLDGVPPQSVPALVVNGIGAAVVPYPTARVITAAGGVRLAEIASRQSPTVLVAASAEVAALNGLPLQDLVVRPVPPSSAPRPRTAESA